MIRDILVVIQLLTTRYLLDHQMMHPTEKYYPLRPEFTESTFYIYQATKDPWYLDVGETMETEIDDRSLFHLCVPTQLTLDCYCFTISVDYCSVHSEEDIRAKAIRLVTNKLYHLTYISEHVEKFATDMLLTAVNSEADLSQTGFIAEGIKTEAKSQITSTIDSPSSRTSDTHSQQDLQTSRDVSVLSFAEAQRLISLFFALCKKKPSLLRLVFEVYGKAPKTVIQAFHRHIPILIRELGSSYKELLHIISDPPKGSENLLRLCSVHSEEDIRAKAIRLVTNKLYHLTYISEHVEKFATDMLLTAVNSEADLSQTGFIAEGIKTEAKSQITIDSPSSRTSDTHSQQDLQTSRDVSVLSFAEAQRLISLFFALCKKKPSVLRLVFEVYGKAPKTVVQAFHRHIPILIRELGSSYKELLHIISDPPKGSENLLSLVLQILTQELAPSSDLITTVKHLYETKLKDVSILIPLLSSLTKDEVLPIFPPLLNLPPEKFQLALAHILQGSAHTGPALTPAEVLIAIHDVVPEKNGPPLKKVFPDFSSCLGLVACTSNAFVTIPIYLVESKEVLQILTQEVAPSSDLIATVKHLYETKLKDVSILIPLLSSLTKDEVLPIFPPLLNLSPEKFQLALGHILQGSAHTGPALTPAEVLIAIHEVVPEKGGPPLKKITDACSACFEQRTVFTQQVLAKALGQMVDRTPLPLLFMRTVIQAIDAFPTLVDVVMEILSKLVNRQIWRLPKLWPGFLKCVSQTQPHSFPVLLELPMPQLESIMKKFPDLRPSLATYANQPTIRASIPNQALSVLGLENGQDSRSQMHPSDAASSIHGAALT
ncbi:hypothetical protein F2Q68_00005674 [Brassica cretica]|uniref:Symplekin C-terminal domain-containing protein n=1 Tax=Brassica cretica TaxID=69181 RepID=A0A8S9JKJ7_BRACR|nr:hypothetical protein F2Q68_00005674 [Brassica cretica]